MLAHKLKQWSKIKDAMTNKLTDRDEENNKKIEPEKAKVSVSSKEEALKLAETKETEKEDQGPKGYLFSTALNFEEILKDWKKNQQSKNPFLRQWAQSISEQFSLNPRLRSTLSDFKLLEEHPFLMEALIAHLHPPASWNEGLLGVSMPFKSEIIYASPNLAQTLYDKDKLTMEPVIGWEEYYRKLMLNSYQILCQSQFDVDLGVALKPFIFKKVDKEKNLETYYEFTYDYRYISVYMPLGEVKLSERKKNALKEEAELKKLVKTLPPESFEFRGLMFVSAKETTKDYCLGRIEDLLRHEDPFVSLDSFEKIEFLARCYFQSKNLHLGVIVTQGDRVVQLSKDHSDEKGQLKASAIDEFSFKHSIYWEAQQTDKLVTLKKEDLEAKTGPFAKSLTKEGTEGVKLLPLTFLDRSVGILEIKSHALDDIMAIDEKDLYKLQEIFAEELDRENQNFRISIQSVILEKYTAIHPSVEWAFRDAALDYVKQKLDNEMAELAPIVFRGVYPLYGASDIRGSSALRNKAIQADLKDQVNAAKAVIDTALDKNRMPKLQEIRFRLESQIKRLSDGLMAGDEITVLEFLNGEVETVFEAIKESIPGVEAKIQNYKDQINQDHGVFYKARKNYDNSVTLLNEAVAAYYDEEQVKFQKFFPHYFEKQCTDGVDHTIYIGSPLVKDRSFHPIYLENIRIWQMMVICGAAYVADNLRSNLPVPLDLTHLIVLQDSSLAIRFSHDEKQFEVDGAYNIRYEIMKKRIDKATIKGTGERLTQPGKLAIVYSSKKERHEYEKYIKYLQAEGYFLDEVEELDVEDLQGIHGLKALRIGINIKTIPKSQCDKTNSNLSNVVSNSKRWLLQKRKEMEDTAQKVSQTAKLSSVKKKTGT